MEDQSVGSESEMEDQSVGSESEMEDQSVGNKPTMKDQSVGSESEMEDQSVHVNVQTNTDVLDVDEDDNEWEQSIIMETSLNTTTSSLGGDASSTKPSMSDPKEMMSAASLQEETIFEQFSQAKKDRDVQRFIGMLVAADVLKSQRRGRRDAGQRPKKQKREYQMSGDGNVTQEINFFGFEVSAKLKQIQEDGQPIQIIGIQNNYYGLQGQQRDAKELKKTCEDLYKAIRAFEFLSWRSYRDVFFGFLKLCFQVILRILQFVWDYKAVTIPAITILLVLYFGVSNILAAISRYIRNYIKKIVMSILRTLPEFALLKRGLGTLNSAFQRVQNTTGNLAGQGMDATKDLFGQGMGATKDLFGQGMDATKDLFGQGMDATKDFWRQRDDDAFSMMDNETSVNLTTGFTGYTFVPGVDDLGNFTNITLPPVTLSDDANGFNFGTFYLDPITGYDYTAASVVVLNGTSIDVDVNGDIKLINLPVDSPVFISPKSFNEVVNSTIQNITETLVRDISDKVAENVNATFTEAINASLIEITNTLDGQGVDTEVETLKDFLNEIIGDIDKQVIFNPELEGIQNIRNAVNNTSVGFIKAIQPKLKSDEKGIITTIQKCLDNIKRDIGRFGNKLSSIYEKIPPFPREFVGTIKTKATDLVKINLKDLKEFFGKENNDRRDELIRRAKNAIEEDDLFQFKRMLERGIAEDLPRLSQSLTQQVNNGTISIEEAYEDIVEAPQTLSEMEIEFLEAITQTCIEKGITPWESTDVAIVATEKDGNEFKAAPHLSYDEFMYYVKLFASGAVAVGLGVRRFMVRPEVAEVIAEALVLKWFPGGRGGGGQWRRR